MQFRFFRRERRGYVSAEKRLVRFRRILQSAQNVRQYSASLQTAELTTPGAIQKIQDIEETVRKLAVQPEHLGFRLESDSAPRTHELQHPLAVPSRTAVFSDSVHASAPNRNFRRDADAEAVEAFCPESIAASADILRELAMAVASRRVALPKLRHAVIAYSGPAEGDLTDRDLDLFWRVFQVPVFEQRLGFDGMLVGRECEVHNGLHVVVDHAVFESVEGELVFTSLTDEKHPQLRVRTGYTGELVDIPCACGRNEPRIKGMARVPATKAAVAAGAR